MKMKTEIIQKRFKMKTGSYFIYFVILCISMLSSCNHDEVVIDENLLIQYNEIANPVKTIKNTEGIDCYIDYSDGMCDKIKSVSNYYLELTDFLKGKNNSVNFFKVGASDTTPKINIDSPESDFRNPKNYIDPVSKLHAAISKMTASKSKSSIFITDFEKIEGGKVISNPQAPTPFLKMIDNTAWAQNDFIEWLMSGNQIDIFARKIVVKGLDNMLYTIVFTPDGVIKDEASYKKSVLKFLIDKKDDNTIHTTYTANNFKIEQAGKDEAIGDANDNLIVQENITKTKDKGFEYYYFKSADLISLNTDESQKDKRIINKLKITSQLPNFTDIKFDIKSYDITSSITKLSKSLTQEAPEVDSNVETGVKDTIANKPIKFKYEKGNEVNDIFEFVYNTDTKETGIKIKPDFTGVTENLIYRIDIIVKTAKLQNFTVENTSFNLNYPSSFSINPLSRSLEYAMKDVSTNIEDRIIYSIYIKIDK